MKVNLFGREIHSPAGKGLVTLILMPLFLSVLTVGIVWLIVMATMSIPLHFLFKLTPYRDHQGFIVRSWEVDKLTYSYNVPWWACIINIVILLVIFL